MCLPSSLGIPLRSSLIEKIRRLGREVRLAQNRENIFDCLQKSKDFPLCEIPRSGKIWGRRGQEEEPVRTSLLGQRGPPKLIGKPHRRV